MPANGRWDLIRRVKVNEGLVPSFFMAMETGYKACLKNVGLQRDEIFTTKNRVFYYRPESKLRYFTRTKAVDLWKKKSFLSK